MSPANRLPAEDHLLIEAVLDVGAGVYYWRWTLWAGDHHMDGEADYLDDARAAAFLYWRKLKGGAP
jgi:hypothetical protein